MASSRLYFLNEILNIQLPSHKENNGELVVMESYKAIPLSIARVFFVRAASGSIRGQHAHKDCTQILVCLDGSVSVLCKDGNDAQEYLLDDPSKALLIPPSIWSQQTYIGGNPGMMVLCDRLYDENDYIRDYSDFVKYRMSFIN